MTDIKRLYDDITDIWYIMRNYNLSDLTQSELILIQRYIGNTWLILSKLVDVKKTVNKNKEGKYITLKD